MADAQDNWAMVGYEDGEWQVAVDERIESKHETKQDAIEAAKSLSVNTVMAFTKGNSNMRTIRC